MYRKATALLAVRLRKNPPKTSTMLTISTACFREGWILAINSSRSGNSDLGPISNPAIKGMSSVCIWPNITIHTEKTAVSIETLSVPLGVLMNSKLSELLSGDNRLTAPETRQKHKYQLLRRKAAGRGLRVLPALDTSHT